MHRAYGSLFSVRAFVRGLKSTVTKSVELPALKNEQTKLYYTTQLIVLENRLVIKYNISKMKILKLIFVLLLLIASSNSCVKESVESLSTLEKLKSTQYFDAEVFAKPDLKIYGTWKLFSVTGGFSGGQHELGFEFLEIKEYGIYGFGEKW